MVKQQRCISVPEDTLYLILGILRLERDGVKNPASNIETAMKEIKDCFESHTPTTAPTDEQCSSIDDADVPGILKTAFKEHDAQVASDAVKQALAPLKAVQEKFSHLDKCLSDPEWCDVGGAAIYGIAGEMWRAIKEAVGGKP
jgi:hypothetical protein